MSTERLVRQALEDSVKTLSCPDPDIDQLLAAGEGGNTRSTPYVPAGSARPRPNSFVARSSLRSPAACTTRANSSGKPTGSRRVSGS